MVNTYKVLTITFAILLLSLMSVSAITTLSGENGDGTLLDTSIGTINPITEPIVYASPAGQKCTGRNGDKITYKHSKDVYGSTTCDKMECRNQAGGPIWMVYETCASGCRGPAMPCV